MLDLQDRPHPSHRVEDEDERDDGERSPLLRTPEGPSSSSPSSSLVASSSSSLLSEAESGAENADDCRPRPHPSPTVLTTTIAASVLILILDVISSVPMAPRLVVFEDILCRKYYNTWGGDTAALGDCKIEPVQSELATINGWRETFDTIPSVLVSIPYGALANYIGRRNVLMLALVGTLLSESWMAFVCWFPQTIPLRALWFSGVFQLIGGGGATVISMCYTMIADVCVLFPTWRTTAFSQVHAAVLLSEIVSIPLGSAFIALNPWIPILGGLGAMAATFLVVLLFSERCFAQSIATTSHVDAHSNNAESSPAADFGRRLQHAVSKSTIGSLWLSRNVLLMLGAFFCCQLSRQFSSVLLQFSTFKFNWNYAEASYLLPLRGGINLAVLYVVIPWLLRYLTTARGFAQWQADKTVTLMSGTCLAIGCIVIFFSTHAFGIVEGQIIIGLGFAFNVTGRSFLTAMVDPRYTSLLYTTVTSITYAGLIVGGPIFAGAFQWGMHLGGIWVGMPFLVATGLFTTATLTTFAATVAE